MTTMYPRSGLSHDKEREHTSMTINVLKRKRPRNERHCQNQVPAQEKKGWVAAQSKLRTFNKCSHNEFLFQLILSKGATMIYTNFILPQSIEQSQNDDSDVVLTDESVAETVQTRCNWNGRIIIPQHQQLWKKSRLISMTFSSFFLLMLFVSSNHSIGVESYRVQKNAGTIESIRNTKSGSKNNAIAPVRIRMLQSNQSTSSSDNSSPTASDSVDENVFSFNLTKVPVNIDNDDNIYNFTKDFPWVDLGEVVQPEKEVTPAPISTNAPTLRPTFKQTNAPQMAPSSTDESTRQDEEAEEEEEAWIAVQAPIEFEFSLPLIPPTERRLSVDKMRNVPETRLHIGRTRTDSRRRYLQQSSEPSVLVQIETALQDYLTRNLVKAFKDQPGLTIANVTLLVTRVDDASSRRRKLDVYANKNRRLLVGQQKRLQENNTISSNKVTLQATGSAEYNIDERVITKSDVLDQSENAVGEAVADETELHEVLIEAGVDTNNSDLWRNSNATGTTSAVEDGKTIESEQTQEQPTLVELIFGFGILGLIVLSLLFWVFVLYKKIMKRRRKKRLAALRKMNSVTVGGSGIRRNPYGNSMEMNVKNLSNRQAGGTLTTTVPHSSGRSSSDYIHDGNGNANHQTMTVLSLGKNDSISNDGNDAYYQGMTGGTNSSNGSEDGEKLQKLKPIRAHDNNGSSKNMISVLDQLDELVASTAVTNVQEDTQFPESPALATSPDREIGTTMSKKDDGGIAGSLLSSYSRFILGNPTIDEENEILNRSFPYGDEEKTTPSKSTNTITNPPLGTKSWPTTNSSYSTTSSITGGDKLHQRENVELTVDDAVEWTDAGMIKITVGGGDSTTINNTNGKKFTPYGDDDNNVDPTTNTNVFHTSATNHRLVTLPESDENITPGMQQKVKSPSGTVGDRLSVAAVTAALLRSAGINLNNDTDDDDGNDSDVSGTGALVMEPSSINIVVPDNGIVNNDSNDDDDNSEYAASLTESMVQEVNDIAQYVEQYESLKNSSSLRSSSTSFEKKNNMDGISPAFIAWKTKKKNNTISNHHIDRNNTSDTNSDQAVAPTLGIKPNQANDYDYDDDGTNTTNTYTNNNNNAMDDDDEESQRLGISRYSVEIPPLQRSAIVIQPQQHHPNIITNHNTTTSSSNSSMKRPSPTNSGNSPLRQRN